MSRVARKVCIIGDFAVGKTSTVARFINQVFSEKYLTTVGVKIDTRDMPLADGRELRMVIWDIAGSDRFSQAEFSYLRGAQAYILVADGTRKQTVESALGLREAVREKYGDLPHVLLLNKRDLEDDWQLEASEVDALSADGSAVFCTSAKTGESVDRAFSVLAEQLCGVPPA